MRRWIKVKKIMFENNRHTSKSLERMANKPATLFDFSRHDDFVDARNTSISGNKGGWRYSDDEVIGGFSVGTLRLIKSAEEFRLLANKKFESEIPTRGEVQEESTASNVEAMKSALEKSQGEEDEKDVKGKDDFVPFLRWEGTIDTSLPERSNHVRRSGFCAIRSPEFIFNGATVGSDYNALEIKCRADERMYTVNVKAQTFFPDDMFQGKIKSTEASDKSSNWSTYVLPFDQLALTAFGRMREVQRSLDGGVGIEHIGFTLADGIDGDFQFDLARIRVVNYYDGEIMGDEENELG